MAAHIPMPQDFATVAPGKLNQQLADHYGVGLCLITRWRKATGVFNNRKPDRPVDFAEHAPCMTYAEMEARWKVSSKTIRAWCAEVGVASSGHRRDVPKRRVAKAPSARRGLFSPPQALSAMADSTDAGQAATYLRRFYPNVYRTNILDTAERRAKGIPGDGRDHFFVGGRGILAANDMIELARSKGFAA